MFKLSRLKIVAYVLAGVSMIVANELQKRDVDEAVNKALDEREQAANNARTIR